MLCAIVSLSGPSWESWVSSDGFEVQVQDIPLMNGAPQNKVLMSPGMSDCQTAPFPERRFSLHKQAARGR